MLPFRMRILIIGGTGLISNYVTSQLVEQGHDVHHLNRRRTPGLGGDVPVLTADRTDRDAFARVLSTQPVWDVVIDMICYLPEDAQQLIDLVMPRCGQLIVASTVDVYQKPAGRYPIREDEPHGPLNDYSRNKSVCEGMLLAASNAICPVTIIRASHTYGPGSQHRGHIVHTFGGRSYVADRIRKGLPIIVHGDGSSFWTSCHGRDVATAFTGAVANARAAGRAYHATAEEWLTWNRYFALVAEAMAAPPPELIHIPSDLLIDTLPNRAGLLRENFQFNNIFDNSAAITTLGFRYRTRFLDGMRETLAWVLSGPGLEDSSREPWYDDVLRVWRSGSAAFQADAARLDV